MMPAIHFLQDRVRLLFGISFSTTDRLRMTGNLGESGLVTLEFMIWGRWYAIQWDCISRVQGRINLLDLKANRDTYKKKRHNLILA